jgi:hypothetical protein
VARSELAFPELKVSGEPCGHARTEGHEAGFCELRLADDEQSTVEIDVRPGKPRNLADAQPEPVEQGKDHRVGRAALPCPVVVRKRGGDVEEPTSVRQIEQVRDALPRLATRPQSYRRVVEHLLIDHPVEQPPRHPKQVIVAAWARSRAPCQERVDYRRRHACEIIDALHDEIAVEQAESSLLRIEAAIQSALMRNEAADRIGKRTMELDARAPHGSASPSPRATSRRVSTATLA